MHVGVKIRQTDDRWFAQHVVQSPFRIGYRRVSRMRGANIGSGPSYIMREGVTCRAQELADAVRSCPSDTGNRCIGDHHNDKDQCADHTQEKPDHVFASIETIIPQP